MPIYVQEQKGKKKIPIFFNFTHFHISYFFRAYETQLPRVSVAKAGTDISIDNLIRMGYVMFPSSPAEMSQILMQGYHDAVAFLARHGQLRHACGTALTVKTKFSAKDVLQVGTISIFFEILVLFLLIFVS